MYPQTDWRVNRLTHYAKKLQLSRQKALKRLELFCKADEHGEFTDLRKEFDRICDKEFWSSNEPGIKFEERQKRLKQMYKPAPPHYIQLTLDFTKNTNNGNNQRRFAGTNRSLRDNFRQLQNFTKTLLRSHAT